MFPIRCATTVGNFILREAVNWGLKIFAPNYLKAHPYAKSGQTNRLAYVAVTQFWHYTAARKNIRENSHWKIESSITLHRYCDVVISYDWEDVQTINASCARLFSVYSTCLGDVRPMQDSVGLKASPRRPQFKASCLRWSSSPISWQDIRSHWRQLTTLDRCSMVNYTCLSTVKLIRHL